MLSAMAEAGDGVASAALWDPFGAHAACGAFNATPSTQSQQQQQEPDELSFAALTLRHVPHAGGGLHPPLDVQQLDGAVMQLQQQPQQQQQQQQQPPPPQPSAVQSPTPQPEEEWWDFSSSQHGS